MILDAEKRGDNRRACITNSDKIVGMNKIKE